MPESNGVHSHIAIDAFVESHVSIALRHLARAGAMLELRDHDGDSMSAANFYLLARMIAGEHGRDVETTVSGARAYAANVQAGVCDAFNR